VALDDVTVGRASTGAFEAVELGTAAPSRAARR
jgi:hypothetical protein